MKQSTSFPLWSRFLITLVALCSLLTTVLLVSTAYVSVNFLSKSLSPEYVRTTFNSIVSLKAPLPDSFSYKMAVDLFGTKSVTLLHHHLETEQKNNQPSHTTLILNELQTDSTYKGDTMSLTRSVTGKIAPMLAPEFQTTAEGEAPVAGETMYFILGTAMNAQGQEARALVGCIRTAKQKTYIVFGLTPGSIYDMKGTKELLNNIAAFAAN